MGSNYEGLENIRLKAAVNDVAQRQVTAYQASGAPPLSETAEQAMLERIRESIAKDPKQVADALTKYEAQLTASLGIGSKPGPSKV